jgi:hypothetical protein
MGIWHRSDQLKTLAFALAGWGSALSFYAAGRTDILAQMCLFALGFSVSLSGVVVGLFAAGRKARLPESD